MARTSTVLKRLSPVGPWLRDLTPASWKADALAGLTGATIVLPQGVAESGIRPAAEESTVATAAAPGRGLGRRAWIGGAALVVLHAAGLRTSGRCFGHSQEVALPPVDAGGAQQVGL